MTPLAQGCNEFVHLQQVSAIIGVVSKDGGRGMGCNMTNQNSFARSNRNRLLDPWVVTKQRKSKKHLWGFVLKKDFNKAVIAPPTIKKTHIRSYE